MNEQTSDTRHQAPTQPQFPCDINTKIGINYAMGTTNTSSRLVNIRRRPKYPLMYKFNPTCRNKNSQTSTLTRTKKMCFRAKEKQTNTKTLKEFETTKNPMKKVYKERKQESMKASE